MYASNVEALVLLLGAFGATSALWTLQARSRLREDAQRARQLATWLDADTQVAVHLAKHVAASRGQPLAPVHVLYALVQAEPVADAIRALDGDPVAIEAAIDARLDGAGADPAALGDPRDATRLLGIALGLARSHEREMTLADALNQIAHTEAAALLAPVSALALLFRLVHGEAPPAVSLWGETHVHVVIRNDDYTTQELVVAALRDAFGLPADRAETVMREAHVRGKAIVGRYAADLAKAKIADVRARAAQHGAPFWIGVEVC